jgi:hypothetical protein
MEAISQQFRAVNSREDMRRAYSHDLTAHRNSVMLKQSREFYLSGDISPTLDELTRKRHKSHEKGSVGRRLVMQVQVQAVNYPILSVNLQEDSLKKLVPHIGKIRHLIKARRWP